MSHYTIWGNCSYKLNLSTSLKVVNIFSLSDNQKILRHILQLNIYIKVVWYLNINNIYLYSLTFLNPFLTKITWSLSIVSLRLILGECLTNKHTLLLSSMLSRSIWEFTWFDPSNSFWRFYLSAYKLYKDQKFVMIMLYILFNMTNDATKTNSLLS